ncbi:MAG: tetraacyldisaccharide 4'-kinase [Deltaproteobacteria bacterium]|nr:tetraacyldisaccharide 4'-kinase [Deltaproteobacteria bacterium]
MTERSQPIALERFRQRLDSGQSPAYLLPLSWLFASGVGARTLAYRVGFLRPVRLERPVVSVGNLTVGANGKTPLVICLANRLSELGVRVAVVSRGYGALMRSPRPVIVSRGQGPVVEASVAGDEPILIATKSRARVVVFPDRVRAARVAIDELDAEVILLDDGFSHRRIFRDLDLLLLDHHRPLGNGKLIPAGTLREPRRAIRRAQALIRVVSSDQPKHWPLPEPIAEMSFAPATLTDLAGRDLMPSDLENARVLVFAAIGRPTRFLNTVRSLGAEIVATRFLEDHSPVDAELWASARLARAQGAKVVITEKDRMKVSVSEASHGLESSVLVLSIALRWTFGLDRVERLILNLLPGPRHESVEVKI